MRIVCVLESRQMEKLTFIFLPITTFKKKKKVKKNWMKSIFGFARRGAILLSNCGFNLMVLDLRYIIRNKKNEEELEMLATSFLPLVSTFIKIMGLNK